MPPWIDHVHYDLNREIKAIGGHYVFLKACTMPHAGRTILYYIGCAVTDSACCGSGGVAFARVAGYVRDLEYKSDDDGAPVSRLEPVVEPSVQKQIRKRIQSRESIHQVEF